MTTRLYVDSVATPSVSPAFDAGFEHTGSAIRRKLATTKAGSALTTITATKQSAVNNEDVLWVQAVSEPLLGAGTLTGTVKGQMRVQENAAAANGAPQMVVTIVSGDGLTVRGTPAGFLAFGSASEFDATGLVNRKFPRTSPAALTSTAWLDGDRIVVYFAVRVQETANILRTYSARIGDSSGTDLPEDDTTTTDDNPWVEFSQTLTFQGGGPAPADTSRFFALL